MIEMQRSAYQRNRQLAYEASSLYMSLIIDGMSQDHCAIPYLAGKAHDNDVMKQKIIGAKQHGFSRSLYRFFPHIDGSSNMACQVVLEEINRRMDHCIANGKELHLKHKITLKYYNYNKAISCFDKTIYGLLFWSSCFSNN